MKIFAILILALTSGPIWACSCVASTDENEFRSATSVLLVRITETKLVPATTSYESDAVHAQFEVVKMFKGELGVLKYLKSEKDTCERPLLAGELYLVYSRGVEYEHISKCSYSRGISETRDAELFEKFAEWQ